MRKLIDIQDEFLKPLKIKATEQGLSFKEFAELCITEKLNEKVEKQINVEVEKHKKSKGGSITELCEEMLLDAGQPQRALWDYITQTAQDFCEFDKDDEITKTKAIISFAKTVKSACDSIIKVNKEVLLDIQNDL